MGFKGANHTANPLLNRAALAAVFLSLSAQAAESDRQPQHGNTTSDAIELAPGQQTTRPGDALDYSPFTPYGRQYALMREELARYRALAQGDIWQPLPKGQSLAPGMRDERIKALRSLLMQYGDYPVSGDMGAGRLKSDKATEPDQYDEALRAAVLRFQRRHGLRTDGVVDSTTLSNLNTPPDKRLEILEANLERWRQMPKDLGQRYILVNIPDFTLRLMHGEEEQYRMRVVVGKAEHETPQLSTRLTRVVFNPTWTVPRNIALRELLPKGSANLVAGGYRLVNNRGKSVPFSGSNLRALRLGSVALQQRGGDGNALGRFKFVIPNRQAIFLHDTNKKNLFSRNQRAFSHGCIRLEKPQELAQIVLASQGNWTEEKLARMTTGSSRTRGVALERPIPVYITYWTAWVDEEGLLNFRPDVYGRDSQSSLAKSGPQE
ncbi:L,D-transpeptidase family protein [Microbulbifer sp. SA54]|uniref:L,D-transpeptidase family protein n=1 Tax=Microbulbifer sp. SA54 TaxID=3401577 RepID=UPI003AAB1097